MSRAFHLGVFIVSTLLMLATGIFLIGDQQFLFSSTYRLTATFTNVAGLANGAEVRVGGISKGTVKGIQLPTQPGGQMAVLMAVESSTRHVIRTDSVASIQTEGLLGSKYVEVSFGSDNAPEIRDGGHIEGQPPLDIADLMKKTSDIMDVTKLTMGDVRDSADHFKEITAKIDRGEGTIGALINDRAFYDRLNEASSQVKVGATAFQENMQALKHNFFLRGFFNKRGYDDSTKLAQHEIADLPQGPFVRKFSYDAGTMFDGTTSAKLKDEKTLDGAGHALEGSPFGLAVVVAHSGMKGDTDEERVLAQARAMNIRDYLVKHFKMDDTRFKTMGVGKNAGDAGMEILIYPPGVRTPGSYRAALNR